MGDHLEVLVSWRNIPAVFKVDILNNEASGEKISDSLYTSNDRLDGVFYVE